MMLDVKNVRTLRYIVFGILSHDVLLHMNSFHEFRNNVNDAALQFAKDYVNKSSDSNAALMYIENYSNKLNGLSSPRGTDELGASLEVARDYKDLYIFHLKDSLVFIPDEKYFKTPGSLHNRRYVPDNDWYRVNWGNYISHIFDNDYNIQVKRLESI